MKLDASRERKLAKVRRTLASGDVPHVFDRPWRDLPVDFRRWFMGERIDGLPRYNVVRR